ncbi:MAG: hypothetical protein IT497_10210 [Ottowia sp.]|nr:hypothetical protein [Ottowia sp.]
MISAEIQRLHTLAWQPGLWMESGWWKKLGLVSWQAIYQDYPSCRSSIDQAIIARRQFPQEILPGMLSPSEALLLDSEEKLTQLVTVMGLIHWGARDALSLGHSRRTLVKAIGESCCNQLLVLKLPWATHAQRLDIDEKDIPDMIQAGCQWLMSADDQVLIKALLIKLPPCEKAQAPHLFSHPPLPTLLTLARFL